MNPPAPLTRQPGEPRIIHIEGDAVPYALRPTTTVWLCRGGKWLAADVSVAVVGERICLKNGKAAEVVR